MSDNRKSIKLQKKCARFANNLQKFYRSLINNNKTHTKYIYKQIFVYYYIHVDML